MAEISVNFEERVGLGEYPVASVFGKSVSANDTLIVEKRDYPDLIIYAKVSDACDVVLEAVSGALRKPDGSYAKISVNETIMSFSAAGEQIIRLSNVLTKKWALHYPFLHLKFTAATTIDLVALPATTTLQEARIVGDDVGLATEATLSGIKTQTDKLQFDANNFLRAAIASDEVGLASETTLSDIKAQLDVTLSTRASESTLSSVLTQLDVTLSTLARLKRWGRDIEPEWVHGDEVTAPAAGTALVSKTVSAGKVGYIYGFFISAGEANDFRINWTSGGAAKSIRIPFSGKGALQYVDFAALNEGLPADEGTDITITNVNDGGGGVVYQARLFYAEV